MTARGASPADGRVWITGAASGIGRALALDFAGRGFQIVATDIDAEGLATLVAEAPPGAVEALPGDVTDAAAMAGIVGKAESDGPPIAIAILAAGAHFPTPAVPLDLGAVRRVFDLNVLGVCNGIAPAAAAMAGRGRGAIWVVASVAGFGPMPGMIGYGATKAALINLAGALKFDLDLQGVRVGVVSPGYVDTPLTRGHGVPRQRLMPVAVFARRVAEAMLRSRPPFEIALPRRFVLAIRFLNLLPWPFYFGVIEWSRARRRRLGR